MTRILLSLGLLCLTATVNSDDSRERIRRAQLPQTTIAELYQLARDENWEVRREVAANRRSPADLLLQLARDPDPRVRIAVTTNLNSPAAVYMLLAKDNNPPGTLRRVPL